MIKLNGTDLEFGKFPNGETNVVMSKMGWCLGWTPSAVKPLVITLKYENDADLIHLMFVKRHLDTILPVSRKKLVITYMPYSRMDRVEDDSVFTLKYIAEFINGLNFYEVIVVEPHSDVTPALLNNCKTTFPSVDIFNYAKAHINFDSKRDYVYFPDAGAEKRYSKLISEPNQLVGFKHRDFKTGKITSLQVLGDVKETGFKVIIIDDLCSYGGTALLGAEKLRELGALEVYLVVGHAEESIYCGNMFKDNLINRVFTTNSIIDIPKEDDICAMDVYPLNNYGCV